MSKETEDKDAMQVEEGFNDVQNALGKAEQFLEDHQKAVGFSVLAVVAVVAIVWLFRSYYIQPREAEAQKEMFAAQYYFEADSFKLALEGNGLNSGFLNVIDEYSSTKAGELATYYAGVCYLRLGEFENAKKYLSDYSGDDEYISTFAIGLVGDAELLKKLENLLPCLEAIEAVCQLHILHSGEFGKQAQFLWQIGNVARAQAAPLVHTERADIGTIEGDRACVVGTEAIEIAA